MSRYGIIDVGSNTVRLCVYEVTRGKDENSLNIDTLLNHKSMAGLASYVVDGVISDQGIKKAVRVIRSHLRNADFYRCREVHVFATACLRNCMNSKEAVRAIEEGISYPIDLLPGEAEAHLGFRGACLEHDISSGVLVDIGGGSVELTRIAKGVETCGISLPQGSLSSFTQYVHGLVPSYQEMERIQEAFHNLLAEYPTDSYAARRLYGIGGSVRSAMKVYGDLFGDGDRLGYLEPAHIETMLDAYCHDAAALPMVRCIRFPIVCIRSSPAV